jgi:hypothetical protein
VTTLRQLKADHLKDATVLFIPETVTRWRLDNTRDGMFDTGTRNFTGQNPTRRATIDYLLGKKFDKVSLTIADVEGRTIKEFDLAKEKSPGFHRIAWDFSTGPAKQETKKGGKKGGPPPSGAVSAGVYRVILDTDGDVHSHSIAIHSDPRSDHRGVLSDDEFDEERRLRRMMQRLQPLLDP